MKQLRILALAATALLAGSAMASAQQAYTTNNVNMRAGPGTRYPAVVRVPEDSRVFIHGCVRNFDWCDVSWRSLRGWVISDSLEAIYRNRRVDFDEYRDYVEIPYVTFGFGYWDRYYRGRPWFNSWDRWGDRNDRRWRSYRGNGGGDWDRNHDGNDNGGGYGDNRNRNGNDRNARGNQRDDNGDDQYGDDSGSRNTGNRTGSNSGRNRGNNDNRNNDNRSDGDYDNRNRGTYDNGAADCGSPGSDPTCNDSSHRGRRNMQKMDGQQ